MIASKQIQKEDCLLFLEKFARMAHVPFLGTAATIAIVLFFGQWPILILGGLENARAGEFFSLTQILWTLPGSLAIFTSLYFSMKLRNNSIQSINAILPLTIKDKHDDIILRLKTTFSSKTSFFGPLAVSFIGAVPLQINNLVLSPWNSSWSELYNISYFGAITYGIWVTMTTWVVFFLVLTLWFYAASIAFTLYKLKQEIGILSIEAIDRGALSPIGTLSTSLASSFLLGSGVLIIQIAVAPLEWWAILAITMFSVGVSVLAFVPIYHIHVLIASRRDEAVREVKARWWAAFEKSDHRNTKAISEVEKRIKSIPTWPFDNRMLLYITGYILIPLIALVVSYLIK